MAERDMEGDKQIFDDVEGARQLVVSQLMEIQHALDGRSLSGDSRIFLLFERAYLEGMAQMAAHLNSYPQSLSELVKRITQERMGFLTGKIETGVLHIHSMGIELDSEPVLDRGEGIKEGGE